MDVRGKDHGSRGAVALETALVMLPFLLLILGGLIVGLGVFRYQQLGYLAREGARWASVHGGQYAMDTKSSAPTATDIYNSAIQPRMNALDPQSFTYSVSWNNNNFPYHTVIDSNNNLVKVTNTVTVTVRYQWVSEAFFGGITLASTSVLPMSY